MTIDIAINGAAGRMGRRLLALAAADEGLQVVQALECEGHELLGEAVRDFVPESSDNVSLASGLTGGAQVLVDFSTPESTAARAGEAAQAGTALVIGTTGLGDAEAEAVAAAAGQVPVLHAPNFSLGVNLVFRLAGQIAEALGADYDIEVVEAHHNQKADAPSGTAKRIAERICEATGRDAAHDVVHGREGRTGPRTRQEVGMHALRMGSVVGDHTVHYGSPYERIELTHRAQTRDVFAAGALHAAKWLAGKPAGTYSMEDVLFG